MAGGGALIAGGGGTVAGTALLGLAGPVGWAIGGGALLTAGLLKSGKNKKLAEQANAEAAKIRRNVRVVEATRKEIQEINILVPPPQLLFLACYRNAAPHLPIIPCCHREKSSG